MRLRRAAACNRCALLVAALKIIGSGPVQAAPPPGHLSPDAAMRRMQPMLRPADVPLTRSGTILSHIDANEYTYIEVSEQGHTVWLAAPKTALTDGASVRFPDGVVMRDFYSKLLQRSFPAVIFVHSVQALAP